MERLGPEDVSKPDREAQDGDVKAEHERAPDSEEPGRRRSDLEGGAWRTEATFDEQVPGPPPESGGEDDNVDPIVHRGE
jgi:hypothetical protein